MMSQSVVLKWKKDNENHYFVKVTSTKWLEFYEEIKYAEYEEINFSLPSVILKVVNSHPLNLTNWIIKLTDKQGLIGKQLDDLFVFSTGSWLNLNDNNSNELTTFLIINKATNQALDSNEKGEVYTLEKNGNDSQKWLIFSNLIQNLATRLYLECDEKRDVYTLKLIGGDYQKWVNKSGRLVNVKTGLCLDSNQEGKVAILESNSSDNQIWQLQLEDVNHWPRVIKFEILRNL